MCLPSKNTLDLAWVQRSLCSCWTCCACIEQPEALVLHAPHQQLTGHLLAQVCAVSGTGLCNTCSVHVMHDGLVVESLFRSPAIYQGVTGLWSIPFTPADASSALIIISFASGSRAMTAGEDVWVKDASLLAGFSAFRLH